MPGCRTSSGDEEVGGRGGGALRSSVPSHFDSSSAVGAASVVEVVVGSVEVVVALVGG